MSDDQLIRKLGDLQAAEEWSWFNTVPGDVRMIQADCDISNRDVVLEAIVTEEPVSIYLGVDGQR